MTVKQGDIQIESSAHDQIATLRAKEKLRKSLEEEIQAYVKKGGKIQEIPFGKSGMYEQRNL